MIQANSLKGIVPAAARCRGKAKAGICSVLKALPLCVLTVFLFTGAVDAASMSVAHVNVYSTSGSGTDNVPLDEKFVQSEPGKVGALTTTDLAANNSLLKGVSQVIMDNSKRLFKLGVSVSLNTTDDDPPEWPKDSTTVYHVDVDAHQYDRVKIATKSGTYNNATAYFRFQLVGGPFYKGSNDPPAQAWLGGQINFLQNGQKMLGIDEDTNESLKYFDGKISVLSLEVPLAKLSPTGTTVDIYFDIALQGYVTKYYITEAEADYFSSEPINSGLSYLGLLVYDVNKEYISDSEIKVTALSGFDYMNAKTWVFPEGSAGKYDGTVVEIDKGILDGSGTLQVKPFTMKSSKATTSLSSSAEYNAAEVSFKFSLNGTNFSGKGTLTEVGAVKFGKEQSSELRFTRRGKPDLILTLNLNQEGATSTYSFSGTLMEEVSGGKSWSISASHAVYTAAKNPVPPLQNVPASLVGKYTVLFMPNDQESVASTSTYPQGYGCGTLTVATSGTVSLAGKLADGTPVNCSGPLLEGLKWPFYASLYNKKGGIGGVAVFGDTPNVSDLAALDIIWTRPANYPRDITLFYPDGWPDGIKVDFIGSKYVVPDRTANQSVLPGLNPVNLVEGNAGFTFADANLAPTPFTKAVNIDAKNKITVVAPGVDKLAATITAGNGKIQGSFIHNTSLKRTSFSGVIFQKQETAAGYFLDPTEGGSVLLDPNSLSDLKTGVTSRDLACSSACLRVSHGFEPP